MRNDFESNYLAHHGILGMKWGRKNGPPYPLGASDHSEAEKKAGWRKSLKNAKARHIKSDADAYRYNYENYEKHMEEVIAKRTKRADDYAKKHNGKRSKLRDGLVRDAKDAVEFERYKADQMDAKAVKAQKEADDYQNNRKGLTDSQKKAIKIGAAVAGTILVAYGGYKLSKYVKTEAGRRIVAEGNKKAAELIKKAGEYRNLAGSAGNLPGQMHRHMLFTQKAVNTENQAAKLLKDTVDTANKTSKSVVDSAKYLYNTPKSTPTPTLTFGASTQKFTKADQDRLSEISNNLLREAQRRNGIATDNTTSFDYAKELIKKNKKTLSQMKLH